MTSLKQPPRQIVLGIDIGTTKVAAVLVDPESRSVLAVSSCPSQADISAGPGRSEQDVSKILSVVDRCVSELPADLIKKAAAVGVTGQMHGVLLWCPDVAETSSLITWQDERCNEGEFLARLHDSSGDNSLRTGFGLASLAWLALYQPSLLKPARGRPGLQASTIHDYLVSLMCGLHFAVTDPSDGASWGLFDIRTNCWESPKIRAAGVPEEVLPKILPTGSAAGHLSSIFAGKWGIPEGVPVAVALGDNQASLSGSLSKPDSQVAVTIGTGAQISVIVRELPPELPPSSSSYQYRPYIENTFAVVAASLSGGSPSALLARVFQEMAAMLGFERPPLEKVYDVLHREGLSCIDTTLQASPTIRGERHDPSLRGSITGISADNFTPGDLAAAVCRGIVTNLCAMLPAESLSGRNEVVGSGNAIRRSPLMRKLIENTLGLPLVLTEGKEEAATGAALLAARLI